MAVTGSCHCGATRFELDFTPTHALRCTCTFCTKRGALWTYCQPDQFRLLTPPENGKVYARRHPENRHFFCPDCGCGTYSVTPDYGIEPFDPNRRKIGVSAHLLDDFDIGALTVEVIDGRNLW
jgi:hypothetical protein